MDITKPILNKNKKIKNTLLILSGKGGTGKTTFAVNLAFMLSAKGYNILLFDADIHGPNVPKLLGIENEKIIVENGKMKPVKKENVFIVSPAFMIPSEESALILRGPMKHKIIDQLIRDIYLEKEIDFMIVDLPPGTGDEALSIAQLIQNNKKAIIIGLSNALAISDVKKAINFCEKLNIPIIGVVENMSSKIFGKDTLKEITKEKNLILLAQIPLKESFSKALKNKNLVINTDNEIKKIFDNIVKIIEKEVKK